MASINPKLIQHLDVLYFCKFWHFRNKIGLLKLIVSFNNFYLFFWIYYFIFIRLTVISLFFYFFLFIILTTNNCLILNILLCITQTLFRKFLLIFTKIFSYFHYLLYGRNWISLWLIFFIKNCRILLSLRVLQLGDNVVFWKWIFV